jgi:hypothetical protein
MHEDKKRGGGSLSVNFVRRNRDVIFLNILSQKIKLQFNKMGNAKSCIRTLPAWQHPNCTIAKYTDFMFTW